MNKSLKNHNVKNQEEENQMINLVILFCTINQNKPQILGSLTLLRPKRKEPFRVNIFRFRFK